MIKQRIKRAIETQGVDCEKLRDLFDVVSVCEDKAERREWLLYVMLMLIWRWLKALFAIVVLWLNLLNGLWQNVAKQVDKR